MNILLMVVIIIFLACCIIKYNRFIEIKHDFQNHYLYIVRLLNQRHVELPKLINLCSQYLAAEEQFILDDVNNARLAISQAQQSENITALSDAENALQDNLHHLTTIIEQYPELQTNHVFQKTQACLSYLESELSIECELYNNAIQEQNILLEQFPALYVARVFHFTAQLPLSFSQYNHVTIETEHESERS